MRAGSNQRLQPGQKCSQSTTDSYPVSAVNGDGLESSRSAPLAVTTPGDITPPSIDSVVASETSLRIVFSEPLDGGSAADVGNYSIDNGIAISAASLAPDQITVTLTTSAHTRGVDYTMTVTAVQDLAGNAAEWVYDYYAE